MEEYALHNDFEICPYNNSHRVQRGTRFQRHLIECRKSYPDVEEEVCPFNFTHRIKKPELKYHISTCPDADIAIKQIVTVKDEIRFEPPVLGPSYETNTDSVSWEESWDDDLPAQPVQIDRSGWNSKLQILNADRLSGLKPAEKRRIVKQLAQGDNLEDIRISQQEEKGEPVKVTSTVLKQLPVPTQEPYTNQIFRKTMGRGVMNHEAASVGSRIRANIFLENSSISSPLVPSENAPISIGRGVASFGARPPPGLDKPLAKMPSFGRGIATLPKKNGNGVAPPGFGMLLDSSSDKSEESDNAKYEDLIAELCSMDINKDEADVDVKPQLSEKEERAKRMRRIEKKLKQIENLKNKIKDGKMLNEEETLKVKGEKKLRHEYESLDH